MDSVSLDVTDRVAICTLNRPGSMNAIDEGVLDGLRDATSRVRGDEDVKAMILTGAGEAFCVGLDIELLGRAFAEPAYFREVLERYKRALLALEALPVPVIAAVNGLARAGGFELLLACDLVLVAEEARIADNHLAFGIVPGGGATQRAPRKLGEQRARELIFTGRWVSGPEAVEAGIALRAVPRASLMDVTRALAATFATRSRAALAATKVAMNEGALLPLEEALDVELRHFMSHLVNDPNAAEGYRAFVEKRDPVWP